MTKLPGKAGDSDAESLSISYGGANVTVDVLVPTGARLTINGISRASESATPPCVVRLSSTVQTDYEWHEFIEAVVSFSETAVDITIDANNQRIAEKRLSVPTQ